MSAHSPAKEEKLPISTARAVPNSMDRVSALSLDKNFMIKASLSFFYGDYWKNMV